MIRRILSTLLGIAILPALLSCDYRKETDWNNPFDQNGGNVHPPLLVRRADTALSASNTLSIRLDAQDANGSIVEYAWDTLPSTSKRISSELSVACPLGGTRNIRWGAADNDGIWSFDTFRATFVAAPAHLSISVDSNLSSWNGTSGTLAFSWNGSIDNTPYESITWMLYTGNDGNPTRPCNGSGTNCRVDGFDSGSTVAYRLVGRNRFGDSTILTGNIKVRGPATVVSIPWNASIGYGSITDGRDGKTYRTVRIGTQTWMAENLRYAGTATSVVGACILGSADSCAKYGSLYNWKEAMAGSASSSTNPSDVPGICPSGWHLPSDAEWSTLQTYLDPAGSTDGTKLKSTNGWLPNGTVSGNGTDTYGFRLLPAGGSYYDTADGRAVAYAFLWTSSAAGADSAWSRYFNNQFAFAVRYNPAKTLQASVRCVEGKPTVASPVFSLPNGPYTGSQSVTLSTTTSGGNIYYTTNGDEPTAASTPYAGAIVVGSSQTIKAVAVKSGMTNSTVASATYTITPQTAAAIPWNTSISYGTLPDTRDGKSYKTVKIGTQTWMAENLNFAGAGTAIGVCYGNSSDSCAKYGRLYTWTEAMGIAKTYQHATWGGSDTKHVGICPSGWHVPNGTEYSSLSGSSILMSTAGWNSGGNGTDATGFRVLPAGSVDSLGISGGAGEISWFWEASELTSTRAFARGNINLSTSDMIQRDLVFNHNNSLVKQAAFSLRCIAD